MENQRITNVPLYTRNASVYYTFKQIIPGLTIGSQMTYIGGRVSGSNDTKKQFEQNKGVSGVTRLDDYSLYDFSLGYRWKQFSIQGKINNIFDNTAYGVNRSTVYPETPRNIYFSITYRL